MSAKEVVLYNVIVKTPKKGISILERDLPKDEADEAATGWRKIFCEDVFFDPVPEVKLERVGSRED